MKGAHKTKELRRWYDFLNQVPAVLQKNGWNVGRLCSRFIRKGSNNCSRDFSSGSMKRRVFLVGAFFCPLALSVVLREIFEFLLPRRSRRREEKNFTTEARSSQRRGILPRSARSLRVYISEPFVSFVNFVVSPLLKRLKRLERLERLEHLERLERAPRSTWRGRSEPGDGAP